MVMGDFNAFPSEIGLGAQWGCHSQEVAELRLLSTYWCSDLGFVSCSHAAFLPVVAGLLYVSRARDGALTRELDYQRDS